MVSRAQSVRSRQPRRSPRSTKALRHQSRRKRESLSVHRHAFVDSGLVSAGLKTDSLASTRFLLGDRVGKLSGVPSGDCRDASAISWTRCERLVFHRLRFGATPRGSLGRLGGLSIFSEFFGTRACIYPP